MTELEAAFATAADVRAFAIEQGLKVGKRGRVSRELISTFEAATGRVVLTSARRA